MYGVDPWCVGFWALEGRRVGFEPADEGAHKEDLGEFAAGVETIGADVCVYFVD